MVDRFLVWVSAGIITTGLSSAMLAGAGLAIADASGTADTSTSEPSDTTDNGSGSTASGKPDDKPTSGADEEESGDDEQSGEEGPADEGSGEEDPAGEEPAEEPDEEPVEDDAAADGENNGDRTDSDRTVQVTTAPEKPKPTTAPVRDSIVETAPETEAAVAEKAEEKEPAARVISPAEKNVTVVIDTVEDVVDTPEVQAVAFASAPVAAVNAAATAPQIPGIIRVIGTIVFNLYAVATRIFGGPPMLPANSSVTVRSSSLTLKCGCDDEDTITVPADWYVPETKEGQPPPERLVYLQHGFLAAGPWYSHTAAALAEQTKSIVVAPSITSNFLAADACWLGAPPMHEAIADLFEDGNSALADSARAAGYTGPIPDRVVLMGHSLGGGAVSGAAGHMTENDSIDRLAGVVLLDGVGLDTNGAMAAALDLVPDAIPIYQLAAPKYFWNQFGVGTAALLQARPDAFIGVTLVGGAHVDTMRGGNPLIQFAQQLVSGFSTPQNVVAARQIMVGWVNDMFAPKQPKRGLYLDRGEVATVGTPRGEATAVALPNSLTKPFIFNFLQPFVSLGSGIFTFEPTCVAASIGSAGSCQQSIAA